MKSMLEVFKEVIEILQDQNIEYMVVGSIASMIYGEPRLTRDMDIVVELQPSTVLSLSTFFPGNFYYLPPHEILSQEVVNRGQFNILHLETMLKVDVMIRKESKHAKEEFSRKVKKAFLPDFEVFVATAEDIIIKKLHYFREGQSQKHIEDIRGILANTEIDQKYLDKWVHDLGLTHEWKNI